MKNTDRFEGLPAAHLAAAPNFPGVSYAFPVNKIPTVEEAVRLIGGAGKLAKLRTETVRLASENIALKLQLALHIARKYCPIESKEDLEQSIRKMFSHPYQVEQLVYQLNKHEGPWAAAVSGGMLVWLPVSNDDIAAVSSGEDFITTIFHHLK